MKVFTHIKAFLKDEEGASGIEYALIAAMVAVVITVSSGTIKTNVGDIFTEIASKVKK